MIRGLSLALLALAVAGSVAWAASEPPAPAAFSAAAPGDALPGPWQFTTLPKIRKHTRYTLVRDQGTVVLRAEARASMASLTHRLRFDPHVFPIVEWRWKIENLLQKSDIASKQGDDFPARLYVLFDYDIRKLPFAARARIRLARAIYGADLPLAALCYVWDAKAARNTSVWSSYTDRVRMIVAESGPAQLGKWVAIRRNMVEDFRAAFGEEPPAVTGVVIATDTDNTGETAVAHYGDIIFRPADSRQ